MECQADERILSSWTLRWQEFGEDLAKTGKMAQTPNY